MSDDSWRKISDEMIIFMAKTPLFQMEDHVMTEHGVAGTRKLPEKIEFDGISMERMGRVSLRRKVRTLNFVFNNEDKYVN